MRLAEGRGEMADNEQESAIPVDDAPAAADGAPISNGAPPKKPRHKRQWGKWPSRVVLALLFLLSFSLSVVPVGRALGRGAIVLPALLTVTQPAPLVLAGEPITHTQTTITSRTGPVYLDVYAPVGEPPPIPGKREAVVMIPGIGDNRTDPQLINLSESMARVGIVFINMTTPDLINFDLLPADEDAVVQAFNFAVRQPGVDPKSVGIVGFSGGSVLACLAAADTRIRDQVAFITLFGTIYDATQVMRDFGLRYIVADGERVPFHPSGDPIVVMANLVAGTLPPDQGQLLIQGLTSGTPLPNPDAQLTAPGAAAAYHLIAGDEPNKVDQNISALSPAVKQLLDELSPRNVVTQIHSPVYLLHAHDDPYIPFTESRAFDAELTRLGHPHEYAEFGGIVQHAEITSGFGLGPLLGDGSKLYRILTGVLSASS
jgi:acetyl esterase/lipase